MCVKTKPYRVPANTYCSHNVNFECGNPGREAAKPTGLAQSTAVGIKKHAGDIFIHHAKNGLLPLIIDE
jgi:hypothetical protein